jgi:hypothetical protein
MAWAPDYATTAELETFMRVPDSADSAVEARAITAASRAVDFATGRQFGSVAAEARYYDARYSRTTNRWELEIDDLMDSTGLTVFADLDGSGAYATAVTGWQLYELNAAQKGRPWESIRLPVGSFDAVGEIVPWWDRSRIGKIGAPCKVTAPWGWSAVPVTIKEAVLLQASRLTQRRDSPYGIAGSPQTGSELRLLAKLDPDVQVAVRPYLRVWAAA